MIVIECKQLSKTYDDGSLKVQVFADLNLQIQQGEQVAIIGRSGEGKSTLLHLLGGLDTPSSGQVLVENQDINALSETKRCQMRNEKLGFIYQMHHLLPEFTVLENVCMPLLIGKTAVDTAKDKAAYLLEKVGLQKRLSHKLAELSGGERQRAAIIRALVTDPICVFADEPTGNLDHQTAEEVYQAMLDVKKEVNTSFLVVTHDRKLANRMDRVLELENGQLSTNSQ